MVVSMGKFPDGVEQTVEVWKARLSSRRWYAFTQLSLTPMA